MAVYKDNATGTWRVIYRFTNWKDQLLKVKWIIEKIEKKFCRKKSMTIRPAVRQAGMGEKDLRFWNVRLIVL